MKIISQKSQNEKWFSVKKKAQMYRLSMPRVTSTVEVMVEVSVRNIVVDVTLRKIPSLFVPKPNGRNQPSSRPKGLALTDRA